MSLFKNMFGGSDNAAGNAKVNWEQLNDVAQLDNIVAESKDKPVVIFKHSTRCSISRMALRQFESNYNLDDSVTPYFLDLIENREVSNGVAQRFNVQHQSPQVLVIRNGVSVYDASHEGIDVRMLAGKV